MRRQMVTTMYNNNCNLFTHIALGSFMRTRWNVTVCYQIELKFGSVGFKKRGKPEYPEKNLSEQGREPTTNSTHIWRRRQYSNLGHIGGRRVISPLRSPRLPGYPWCKNIFFLSQFLIVRSVWGALLNRIKHFGLFHPRYFEDGPLKGIAWIELDSKYRLVPCTGPGHLEIF